jgi:predicted phosphodiesterase
MIKRIAVVSDVQYPFHARKAVKAVIKFIGDWRPDEVVLIGDCLDFPSPSRWNKDTRGEFEGSIYDDCEGFKKNFLEPLRAVYDGPVGMHEGNHDLRPRQYLDKYAPALTGTHAFDIESLLDFDDFEVSLLPAFYEIAPGWLSTHGHLGKISLSRIPGNTALGAAKKFGKSVVMGHTHRMGIGAHTTGYGGNVSQTLWGMEVGNLMDMKLASYLQLSTANWQTGFGILTVDGASVKPETVPIVKGRFSVDGHVWEV